MCTKWADLWLSVIKDCHGISLVFRRVINELKKSLRKNLKKNRLDQTGLEKYGVCVLQLSLIIIPKISPGRLNSFGCYFSLFYL